MTNERIADAPDCALDFSDLLDDVLADYIPRRTVENAIRDVLIRRVPGCCVLFGPPGCGKTSLAASFIRSEKFLHHFLRQGHSEFTLWRDPYAFYASVGFQLKALYGDAIFPATVNIDVTGRVNDVAEHGVLIGAEVQQLVSVPWHSTNLTVMLNAQRVSGKTIGVRIENIIEDYRRIPLLTFRNMALVEPLRRLKILRPNELVTLWIDGLDEDADWSPALAKSCQVSTIVESLPIPEEIEVFGNLRLVLSSRPTMSLNRFVGADRIDLRAPQFAEDATTLVERYLDREFSDAEVVRRVTEVGRPLSEIRQKAVEASDRNVLYARQFCVAVRDGALHDLLAGEMPAGLENIYVRLLNRTASKVGERYVIDYHPLVSTLAIAARGLTLSELRRLSGLDEARVNAALARLTPFLNGAPRLKTYGFYHQSLRDCLASADHEAEIWHVEPPSAHGRIARAYLSGDQIDIDLVDDYGFNFLTMHLARAGSDYRKHLYPLINRPWRLASRRYFGSTTRFEADVTITQASTRELPFPQGLVETSRLALIQTHLTFANEHLPSGALEVLAALGQIERALEHLRSGADPARKVALWDKDTVYFDGLVTDEMTMRLQRPTESADVSARRAEILRGLASVGPSTNGAIASVLNDGLSHLERDLSGGHSALADLLAAVEPGVGSQAIGIEKVIDVFNQLPQSPAAPHALAQIGRWMSSIDRARTNRCFTEALQVMLKILKSPDMHNSAYLARHSRYLLGRPLGKILRCWAECDADAAASAMSQHGLVANDFYVEDLLMFAKFVESANHPGTLNSTKEQLQNVYFPAIGATPEAVGELLGWARFEVKFGRGEVVGRLVTRALELLEKINLSEEVNHILLLVEAAEVDLNIDQRRAQTTLARAWSSVFKLKSEQMVPLESLVRAQFRADPDLLAAYLNRLDDRRLKAHALVAMAKIRVKQDGKAAAKLIQDALNEAEIAHIGAWRPAFYFELAKWRDPNDRVATENLLQQAGVDCTNVAVWRLDVLLRLIAAGSTQVRQWFGQTLESWANHVSDWHTFFEFPLLFKQLPENELQHVLHQVSALDDPLKQGLLLGTLAASLRYPDTARQAIGNAVNLLTAVSARTPVAGVCKAFVASQLWSEGDIGKELWLDALLQLKDDPGGHTEDNQRRQEVQQIILALARGNTRAALPYLLTFDEPTTKQGHISLTIPRLRTPDYVLTGMSERDYWLAQSLGEEAARQDGAARQRIETLTRPVIRCLAYIISARAAGLDDVALKVHWCNAAEGIVSEVEPHYVRCLLRADIASTFYLLGVIDRARQLALITAEGIFQGIRQEHGTIPRIAYGHALGRCARVLSGDEDKSRILEIVWGARVLGPNEIYLVLSYLPEILHSIDSSWVQALLQAESVAKCLYE